MTKVIDVLNYIKKLYPLETKEEWDNCGLLIGDEDKEVSRCVLSLDATRAVTDFTISMGAELILTHHPIIFNPIKNVPFNSVIAELIKEDITAISIHTPFDKGENGTNDNLAKILEITDIKRSDNAFLVYGKLSVPMSIDDLADFVSEKLTCNGLRYTDSESLIETVAICTGAGDEFLYDAMKVADCFITGDSKYHVMLEASEMEYPMMSAGHFETEFLAFSMLKDKLSKEFPQVEFIIAPEKNPILAV